MRQLSNPVAALIAVLCCAADQAIKALVVATMELGERIAFLPFLDWLHARNFGVAFSFLGNAPGMAISLLTAAITVFVIILMVRTPVTDWMPRFAFALIIGGALGNLIDRVRLGYVVDYVYFHTPVFDFAIFNLADTFITIGAGLLILSEFWPKRDPETGEETTP